MITTTTKLESANDLAQFSGISLDEHDGTSPHPHQQAFVQGFHQIDVFGVYQPAEADEQLVVHVAITPETEAAIARWQEESEVDAELGERRVMVCGYDPEGQPTETILYDNVYLESVEVRDFRFGSGSVFVLQLGFESADTTTYGDLDKAPVDEADVTATWLDLFATLTAFIGTVQTVQQLGYSPSALAGDSEVFIAALEAMELYAATYCAVYADWTVSEDTLSDVLRREVAGQAIVPVPISKPPFDQDTLLPFLAVELSQRLQRTVLTTDVQLALDEYLGIIEDSLRNR